MKQQADREISDKSKAQDLIGLVMCGLGGLFGVSIFLSLGNRAPQESLWTAPVVGLIEAVGSWPGLALSLGLAVLGTALFLKSREMPYGRHLLGILGLSLGLALAVGAFSASAGGALGSALPETFPGTPGDIIAVVLGVCVLLVSVWLSWLGTERAPGWAALAGSVPAGLDAGRSEGVSQAEAAALVRAPRAVVPAEPPRPAPLPQPAPQAPAAPPVPQAQDVRVAGGVPRGTQPLTDGMTRPKAAIASPPPVETVTEGEGQRVRLLGSPLTDDRSPIAPTWETEESDLSAELESSATTTEEAPELDSPEEVAQASEALESVATEPVPETPAAPAPVSEPEPEVEAQAAPQPVEVEPEASRPPAEPVQVSAPPAEEEPAEKAGLLPPQDWEQANLFDEPQAEDVGEEVEAAELEEEGEEPEAEEVQAEEEEYEEEEEYDEDEEEDEEEEEPEDGEQAEYEEDDDEEYEDEEDDEEEEYEDGDGEYDEDEEYEEEAEYEEDDEEEYEDEDGEEEQAEGEEEPEQVLEPVAPPLPAAAEAPEGSSTRSKEEFRQLVFDSGCMILEENRVAVSMIERRFEMDFQEACIVLDELQSQGLIGPYMGGRTRDILLSPKEWLARNAEREASSEVASSK